MDKHDEFARARQGLGERGEEYAQSAARRVATT